MECEKCGSTLFKRGKINNAFYCKKCNTKHPGKKYIWEKIEELLGDKK